VDGHGNQPHRAEAQSRRATSRSEISQAFPATAPARGGGGGGRDGRRARTGAEAEAAAVQVGVAP